MRNKSKIWLIVATALFVLGTILFVSVMTACRWDFTKLNTVNHETNTHQIDETFNDISVHTDTADIRFVPSEDGACKVVCKERAKEKHAVSVEKGELTVRMIDKRKWYDHIGISFGSTSVTVYLPQTQYFSLSVHTDTGDITIPKEFTLKTLDVSGSTGDVTCHALITEYAKIAVSTGDVTLTNANCQGDVSVKVSTGKAYLQNVTCQNLVSNGNTGDLTLKNVIATGNFTLTRSSGDIAFDGCDASQISVETDTGDVTGTLRSPMAFTASTNTGKVIVPENATGGGICKIRTDTGDIVISLLNP